MSRVEVIDGEIWKPVYGWEGFYEVSSLGRVKSVTRRVPHPICGMKTVRERLMRLGQESKGYWRCNLKRDGGKENIQTHVLVLEAFVGPRPEGGIGCHGPLGNTVNTPGNLSWGTYSSNALDKRRDGTVQDVKGEKHPMAKMTAEDVRKIRELRGVHTKKKLGEMFGITARGISQIQHRATWKHVA